MPRLNTDCAKNYCNRTLIVKVVENVVTRFLGHSVYTLRVKKTGPLFMAYNFRNIEQIFTKFGANQSLFILKIVPEFI